MPETNLRCLNLTALKSKVEYELTEPQEKEGNELRLQAPPAKCPDLLRTIATFTQWNPSRAQCNGCKKLRVAAQEAAVVMHRASSLDPRKSAGDRRCHCVLSEGQPVRASAEGGLDVLRPFALRFA